jgi:hypothetical protein
MIRPPNDWHPISARFLDPATVTIDLVPNVQSHAKWDLEKRFRLGGHLRALSDSAKRRLRRRLKSVERNEAKRFLRLLDKHTEPDAFLGLVE